MRIENEIKLDYKDVLIRPKRSTLKSRKEVMLHRQYKFRNSGQFWQGIPIMAANMDGVGTFNMAKRLSDLELFTCITKQITPEDWYNRFGQICFPVQANEIHTLHPYSHIQNYCLNGSHRLQNESYAFQLIKV